MLPERLPRPSVWPITLALGVTLLAFGVVTNWIMSVVGLALLVVATGGWFMELRYDQLQ
ncbi:MAG: cytochrome c oxidase subunit 4 [Cyanobacteria bacterium SZAS-4]|nr:cytochrome c oxidase subunit 4 [Cyanobacteria bacterium SZAS-4]